MIQINQQRLDEVIQRAFDKAQSSRHWQTAIVRAKQIIEENPFIHMDGDTLLLLSDSNEIYEVTSGKCQQVSGRPCPAFNRGQPCKHRALRRLLLNYSQMSH
ncbi:MAG: hypothetical protein WCB68_07500 [Pyrinomonadaceae bacterium]